MLDPHEYWAHKTADMLGYPRPIHDYPHWLKLHRSEASMAMYPDTYDIMLKQIGDTL